MTKHAPTPDQTLDPTETYPSYTRSEVVADAVLHGIGIALAITGTGLLMVLAAGVVDAGVLAGLTVYGTALIGSFIASALYHLTPWDRLRPTFRRIDQAAIYFKIAGTYTPLAVLVGTGFAYAVLGFVWVVAVIGALAKFVLRRHPGRWGAVIYLGLGWMSLALIWSLFPILPLAASVLIVAGGLLYSVGVVLFYWADLRFETAIWHGHVLAASACFFIAIALGALAVA